MKYLMTLVKPRQILILLISLSVLFLCRQRVSAQGKLEMPLEESLTWIEFRSEEGRFRVKMPDRPKREVLTLETQTSRVAHTTFTVEKGPFIWLVDYADFPLASVDQRNSSAFLNQARDELLRESAATLRHEKSLNFKGYPGLEITLDIAGGEACVRFYLVKNRLYQLAVTRLNILSTSNAPMRKFLESFELIEDERRISMSTILKPVAGSSGRLRTYCISRRI
jgi:hypothetical protein